MLGIGCDLADVERIEKAITRKGFKERVYTPMQPGSPPKKPS